MSISFRCRILLTLPTNCRKVFKGIDVKLSKSTHLLKDITHTKTIIYEE